ncbi:p-loop domain-containing protein [Desulfonema limicola]|uniref:P-loop domain-containing protein n=1 Tax=Desulfonema limicola TaxID=45656 RepID=A0A975BD52_9BACT|nr:hypothetical protein [Desulfonema limicola]QTA83281.1 p-loop domain-containing protein [Desulfonema limicola]
MPDNISKITGLTEAYHNFGNFPLTEKNFEKFGISLMSRDSADSIIKTIETSERLQKILVIGHSGCGKTTVLRQVAADEELNKKNHVIMFSLSRELNLLDTDALDIMLVVYMHLIYALPLDLSGQYLESFRLLTEPAFESLDIKDRGFDLMKIVSFNIKTNYKFRKNLRKTLKKNIIELQKSISIICREFSSQIYRCYRITDRVLKRLKEQEVSEKVISQLEQIKGKEYKSELKFSRILKKQIGDVQTMHYKPVIMKYAWVESPMDPVIIIDSSDKLIHKAVKQIFFEESHILRTLEAKMVFSFPLSAYYHPNFFQIRDFFLNEFIRPVHLYDMSGYFQNNALQCLSELIEKRIDKDLITHDALQYIITSSGGLLRDLVRMMQMCCKSAVYENKDIIDKKTAQKTVNEMADMYARFLDFAQYREILEKIMKTRFKTGMLHNNLTYLLKYHFVLEYGINKNPIWYDVHPCLKESFFRQ